MSEQETATKDGRLSWSVGTRLVDSDNDNPDAEVWVVEQVDETISEVVVYETDDGTEETVYDYHRGQYETDEPVVRCVYVESVIEAFPEAVRTDDDLGIEAVLRTLRDLDVESIETEYGYVTVYAFPHGRLVPSNGGDTDE
ncbi:hypothetical protein [Salinibaculum salinum]|uniref:hypothetical protein n=1 Tax=Salinibaculum salinum TaxID=3131996 RepID=UPI0030EBF61B